MIRFEFDQQTTRFNHLAQTVNAIIPELLATAIIQDVANCKELKTGKEIYEFLCENPGWLQETMEEFIPDVLAEIGFKTYVKEEITTDFDGSKSRFIKDSEHPLIAAYYE